MGNSLLRDVRVDKTSSGNPIKIRKKSGAILADIEQMIDDAANTETIDEIFIDRGTHETTSEVSVANIKENIAECENREANHHGEQGIAVEIEVIQKKGFKMYFSWIG